MASDEEEPDLNNPAARLLFWLEKAQAHADKVPRQGGNQRQQQIPSQVRHCWCLVWDLPNAQDGWVEYQRRGVAMIEAAAEARRLVEQSPNPLANGTLEHFSEVEAALNVFMEAPTTAITAMMDKIKGTGWHSMKMADTLLRTESPEQTLAAAEIDDLLVKVDVLRDEVLKSDLTADQKAEVLAHVADVEGAVRRARVTGSTEVLRAANGLTGVMVRLAHMGAIAKDHPVLIKGAAVVSLVITALGVTGDLSSIASGPLGEVLGLPGSEVP